jgi:hypothetical protein
MGTSIGVHFVGHLIGGLTWEPMTLFAILTVLASLFRLVRGSD